MGIDFTVYKGSEDGSIVEAKGHRDVGPTEALIEISHCGVCGTDEHYRHYDMGLGHEGVGRITQLGEGASRISDLKVGDRVGFGWMQKTCGYCRPCLTGQDVFCLNSEQFGTANHDEGGFGTGVARDVTSLTKIPDAISSEDAGPLLCGGATVWGPLVHEGPKAGDRIGVVGIGGLGHLAIQFAAKLGYEVVVFSTTENKRDEALKFGATEFHATAGVKEFKGIKPIDHLLITISTTPDLALYMSVMAKCGKIYPLTISFDAPPLPLLQLVVGGLSIVGSVGCCRYELRTMMDFAARHGVRPQIQKWPMTQKGITDAMQTLADGKMRYRGVVEV